MNNERINLEQKTLSKLNFNLRYISISKYEGDWQSLPHTHHFTELFYVVNGSGIFHVENDLVPVKPNDLMIINPHVEHTEKTRTNNPMEYIVFGVDGLAFSYHGKKENVRKNFSHYSYTSSQNRLVDYSRLMLEEFREKKPGYELVCQGILQVLLVFISRELDLSIISDSTFQISKECAFARRSFQLSPEHHSGHFVGNHSYQQILPRPFFRRMHRAVTHQLSVCQASASEQGAAHQHQPLHRADRFQYGVFFPVLLFTDFQKIRRDDASAIQENTYKQCRPVKGRHYLMLLFPVYCALYFSTIFSICSHFSSISATSFSCVLARSRLWPGLLVL